MSGERLEPIRGLGRENYDGVVRLAYLITGDRDDALDVAQEAFARTFERWRQGSAMRVVPERVGELTLGLLERDLEPDDGWTRTG